MNGAARLFARGFMLQALFNPRGQQRGGLRWIVGPRAEELASEPFNANPVLAGYAIGLIVRGGPREYAVRRGALEAVLGGVGDRLLWGLLRPLSVIVGLAVSVMGPLAGAAALLAVYNPAELALRWRAVRVGLEGMPAVQSDLSRGGPIGRLGRRLARLCALGVGVLAGSWLAGHLETGRYLESGAGVCVTIAGWLILRRRSWDLWRLPLAALLLGLVWFAVETLRASLGPGARG